MKKFISLTILAGLTFFAMAQAPQGFSYQAVLRDSEGQPLAEQQVSIRLTLQDEAGETSHYAETHTVTTSPQGVVSLVVGSGTPVEKAFVDIPWNEDNVYIKVEVDPTGGSSYSELGTTKLQAVPYALHAQSANRFIAEPGAGGDEPLFVVRNSQEQIVFAVYEKGVRMYVEDDVVTGEKGNKSGFAIGGLTGFKQNDTEYFRVTPDSVRIYLREPADKGNKGGFAIGGLTGFKADTVALMFVAPDSTRFYIDSEFTGKGNKSGFAIGGLTGFKSGAEVNYFNISTDTTAFIDPSEARILWYPTKNAFLVGQVLIEDPDSVGTNSMATGFESKAIGNWSQAMGYQAIARGNYSTAIGKNAIADSLNTFAFGDGAKALNEDAYAFGAFTEATGIGSFAFGYVGRDTLGPTGNITIAEGDYSFAMGLGSRTLGESAVAIGSEVLASAPFSSAFGHKNKATNWYALSFGTRSEATGEYAIAMGYFAKAVGELSYAIGTSSEATSKYSLAIGLGAKASAFNSIAIGTFVYALANNSTAIGHYSIAEGEYSTSIGKYSNAKGENSFAIGYSSITGLGGNKAISIGPYSEANGSGSMAFGSYSIASGAYSVAIGSTSRTFKYGATAIGDHADAYNRGSVAIGSGVQAYGRYSAVMGMNAYAHAHSSFVFGSYNEENTAYDSTAWIPTDPLFILANGTGYGNRSNALTVLKNGNMGIGISAPTEKLQVIGNATVSGTVTASEFIGDFSGDIEGNVTGNLTGAVNDLTMGKINLTSSGIIASIYNNEFNLRWEKTTQTIYLENISGGDYCHIWWQCQKGAASSGESYVTDDPELLVDKDIEDGYGYQINFGDAQGGTAYCSVWVQYSSTNQRLIGHYTKF